MDRDSNRETSGDRLVYFAAERTLMSWVRTAAALMVLGFVIDRFSFFLRKLNVAADALTADPQDISSKAGPALVVVGAAMAAVATVRYLRFALYYRRYGRTDPGHGLFVAVLFAARVTMIGVLIAVFLLTVAH